MQVVALDMNRDRLGCLALMRLWCRAVTPKRYLIQHMIKCGYLDSDELLVSLTSQGWAKLLSFIVTVTWPSGHPAPCSSEPGSTRFKHSTCKITIRLLKWNASVLHTGELDSWTLCDQGEEKNLYTQMHRSAGKRTSGHPAVLSHHSAFTACFTESALCMYDGCGAVAASFTHT